MALARVFIAMTLDGYIADSNGGVDFLDPFERAQTGLAEFFDSIGSLVMGRTTFDWVVKNHDWPYAEKPTGVLTSRPLGEAPPGVRAINTASRAALDALAGEADGDVWLVGGGRSLAAFDRENLIDRWEIGIIPVRLGSGIPLFPETEARTRSLHLIRLRQHDMGIVECWYEPAD